MQLKTLPLIDTADLDAEFAAYDAFELLLGAVLRAALVEVPPAERYDNNGELFKRFVVERFPAGRGFGNTDYASKLWKFRNAVVKNKQTGPFLVIHNAPSKHWKIERGARVLDLQSLVADYRKAVDNLAPLLRSSPEMKALATAELAGRTVRLVTITIRTNAPRRSRSPSGVIPEHWPRRAWNRERLCGVVKVCVAAASSPASAAPQERSH